MEFLSVSADTLALLLVAALLAGWVDSIAGGGGLIALPALLAAGLPPHAALGTNKLAGTFGTFSAARAYIAKGILKPRLWLAAATATFVGACFGTLAVWLVSSEHLQRLLPPVIALTALYVLTRRPRPAVPALHVGPAPRGRSLALGAGLGFYDGFIGPGTGALWTAAAMAWFRLDLLHASGVARFMNLISNVVSLATFMALGAVNYGLGLAMGAALMLGARLGAHSAIRYGAPFIRPVFATVVLLLAVKLARDAWLA